MTDAAYQAHPALALAAEATLPILGALTLILPAWAWRAGRLANPGLFFACAFSSIALLYLVREVNLKTGFSLTEWKLHFSSHTAVAISFAVTLIAFRFMLLPAAAVVVGSYLWLITLLPYHSRGDVFMTAAAILPLSILCHLPWWLKKTRQK